MRAVRVSGAGGWGAWGGTKIEFGIVFGERQDRRGDTWYHVYDLGARMAYIESDIGMRDLTEEEKEEARRLWAQLPKSTRQMLRDGSYPVGGYW